MSNIESRELELLQLVLRNEGAYRKLLAQEGSVTQSLLDWLQQLIDAPTVSKDLRASICQTMVRLSKRSSLCPSCLTIRGVTKLGEHPVAGGGFGDIWKGRLGSGQLVCLKVVKVYLMSDMKRSMKEYLREAIIWRQLRHPNVLPCLGLYYLDDMQQRICLVSPWMENGNLVEYIQTHPRESINHILLMHDITSGLSHLHALKIVHGDLKGFNVLITRSHRACLADFGLSHVSDSQVFKVTSTVAHSAGTARWSAPEIHTGASSSTQSDIYSIGCLYYEIITGLRPFYNLRNDAAVLLAVLQGQRPEKPRNVDIDMQIWSLMNDCWETDPSLRPTAEDLLQRLPVYGGVAPSEDWDNELSNELQRNVAASDKAYSPLASIFYQSGMRLRSPSALTSSVIADNPRAGRKRIRLQSDFGKAERQRWSHIPGMKPGFSRSLRGADGSQRPSRSSTYRYDNATSEMGMGVGGTAQITGSPEPEQHPSDAWGTFMRPAPAGSSSNSSYPYTQGAEPSSWLPSGSNLDISDNRVNHTLPTLPAFSSLLSTTNTIRQPGEQQQAGFRNTNDLGRFETAVLTRELPNLNFGRDMSWSSFFYGDPSAKPNTLRDEGRW